MTTTELRLINIGPRTKFFKKDGSPRQSKKVSAYLQDKAWKYGRSLVGETERVSTLRAIFSDSKEAGIFTVTATSQECNVEYSREGEMQPEEVKQYMEEWMDSNI